MRAGAGAEGCGGGGTEQQPGPYSHHSSRNQPYRETGDGQLGACCQQPYLCPPPTPYTLFETTASALPQSVSAAFTLCTRMYQNVPECTRMWLLAWAWPNPDRLAAQCPACCSQQPHCCRQLNLVSAQRRAARAQPFSHPASPWKPPRLGRASDGYLAGQGLLRNAHHLPVGAQPHPEESRPA